MGRNFRTQGRTDGGYTPRYERLDTVGKRAEPRLVGVINNAPGSEYTARLASELQDEMQKTDLYVQLLDDPEAGEFRVQLKTTEIDKITLLGFIQLGIIPLSMNSKLLSQAARVSGELQDDEIAVQSAYDIFEVQFLAYKSLVDRVRAGEQVDYSDIADAQEIAQELTADRVAEANEAFRAGLTRQVFEPDVE